jgi:oligopeptidase B
VDDRPQGAAERGSRSDLRQRERTRARKWISIGSGAPIGVPHAGKSSMKPVVALLLSLLVAACGAPAVRAPSPVEDRAAAAPAPPVAARREFQVRAPHGASRSDPYYWLRDDGRSDPDMLAYLNAENAYADAMLAPLESLEATINDEIVARIKQDDATVPVHKDDYWYYTRYEPGQEYPIHARRRGSMEAPEEILLDGNALAAGKAFHQIGNWEISPDQNRIAWAEDLSGRRQYVIRVKDLVSGRVHDDAIPGASSDLMWGDDNATLYYIENDPVTLLTRRVKRHVLGAPVAHDALVYEEADNSFYMRVARTRSDDYLCISVQSTVSSESRCTPAAHPGEFRVIAPRERDVEYSADHLDGQWVILTNWNAPNYRIMRADDDLWGDRRRWREWIAHRGDVFIGGFELFDGFTAISERSEGLLRLRVVDADDKSSFVQSDEPAYTMELAVNAEPDTQWLRYSYTSLTTPLTTYELNVRTAERRELKREPVLGGFDSNDYVTERLWAPARDGTRIPVSIVYHRGFPRDGSGALLQNGYGSYGSNFDPEFSSPLVSLLDRGVAYAIAHVRGGQEMGRQWYDDGKLLNKKNSFTDFIDVTDFLVREGYAAKDRVAATGRSAGGLLMGAIANMAPDRYRVIDTAVPFVDAVTTMLDASIPLTTNEYDEWGNPEDPTYYDYMLSYSPYDQITAQDYPAIYVSTGLWDSQVQYYEPAKWVARLRAMKTDDNPLIFRIDMEAGHGGKSGRFQRYRETAEWYAFVLDQLDAVESGEK